MFVNIFKAKWLIISKSLDMPPGTLQVLFCRCDTKRLVKQVLAESRETSL